MREETASEGEAYATEKIFIRKSAAAIAAIAAPPKTRQRGSRIASDAFASCIVGRRGRGLSFNLKCSMTGDMT